MIAPAPGLTPARRAQAQELALRIAKELGVTGLLAVEVFETPAGLLVNELAMRPHNTGHWTIEGARTSQLSSICGPFSTCRSAPRRWPRRPR